MPAAADPLAAIKALNALATPDGTAILVLRNFHRFLGSAEVVQALDTGDRRASRTGPSSSSCRRSSRSRSSWRSSSSSSSTTCPAATSSRRSPAAIATEPGELPEGDDLGTVLDAAAGLTRVEAENAFSLSLVRHGRVVPETLWELKTGHAQEVGPADPPPGRRDVRRPGRPGRPEGVPHAGPAAAARARSGPGASCSWACRASGKSAFAKALGQRDGRPTLVLDVGALMGSLVGQTEERTSARPCASSTRWPRASCSSTRSRRPSPASSRAARPTAASVPGCSGRCSPGSTTTRATSSSSPPATTSRKLPPEFSRAERLDGDVLPRPARPAREGRDLADVPREVRPRPRPAPAQRP